MLIAISSPLFRFDELIVYVIFMTRTFKLIMGVLPPRDVARIVESYIWPTDVISDEAMAEAGHYEMCMKISPDHGLRGACRGGNREIAEMMITAGGNLWYGLVGACAGGNIDLAEWLFSIGCLVNDSAF
jgi:hypothetical protein